MSKTKRFGQVCLIFMFLFFMVLVGASVEYQRTVASQKEALEDDLRIIKNNIEQMITARMINARGVAGLIEVTGDLTEEAYILYAKEIYRSSNNIVKDVVLVEDTTIRYVYPEAYKKDVIGVDIATIEAQRAVALYTKETGKSIFIGPVDLIEGGEGIIVRVPIKVADAYYGQLSIAFDYEAFLENSGLRAIAKENHVSLSGIDPVSGASFIIWQNRGGTLDKGVHQSLNMEGIRWTVSAFPMSGWQGASPLYFLMLIIGFIISFAVAVVYHRQLSLENALLRSNDHLKESVEALELNKQDLEYHLAQIRDKESYIAYLAEHDLLTELWNRRKFMDTIKALLAKEAVGRIVLLDLDNFKNINDTYGHIYGDGILKRSATALVESIGDKGTAYRFGGDEFLLHFPGEITEAVVIDHLKTIAAALARQKVQNIQNHITMSAGVVSYPKDGRNVEALLIKADVAMYKAKSIGKNNQVFFQEHLLSDFGVKVSVERALRSALDGDGFMIYYQPIVDIHTGHVASLEALIRMKEFQYGPMTFIPVAEETGLIMPLGMWIIEEVAKQISLWQELGIEVKPVAINLSPKQLLEADFVPMFFAVLERYNVPTDLIHVEITESVLLENEDQNVSALNTLHDAGIKISMDDFGTGYSSLNYLTYLPVDKVKLDKSLKDKFLRIENTQVMAGIINMSHGLNLAVVAEGVESMDEWQTLLEAGCDYLQGYHFSKPVPAAKIVKLLSRQFDKKEAIS